MSYFIAAGLIGAGIVAYQKRNQLIYKSLEFYNNIQDHFNDKTKINDEISIKFFILNESKLECIEIPDKLFNKIFIVKITYKTNHIHILHSIRESGKSVVLIIILSESAYTTLPLAGE